MVLLFYFTESCSEYLILWLQHADFLAEFNWIALNKTPEWDEINKTARLLIEKGLFAKEQHQKLFHNVGVLKASMHNDQILEYSKQKLSIVDRWVHFFNKCAKENYDCEALITIVSYVLTIPGISPLNVFLISFYGQKLTNSI